MSTQYILFLTLRRKQNNFLGNWQRCPPTCTLYYILISNFFWHFSLQPLFYVTPLIRKAKAICLMLIWVISMVTSQPIHSFILCLPPFFFGILPTSPQYLCCTIRTKRFFVFFCWGSIAYACYTHFHYFYRPKASKF